MEKSSSHTVHSWCRLCSWPCACAVSRATLWPATCCTISCVPQRSPTPQTTAVCLVASTDPCKSTCPLRYYKCVQYMCRLLITQAFSVFSNVLDHCWSHEFSLPPFLIFAQDWGRPGDLWHLDIRWHVPSTEETAFVFYVLDLLLQPELQRLQRYAQGEQDMSRSEVKSALCNNGKEKKKPIIYNDYFCFLNRDDVLQSLCIVQHCLLGAGSMLPPLDGTTVSGL